MPRKGGVNEKKVAGNERKAANAAAKSAAAEREEEKANVTKWQKGANVRGGAREEAAAQKADEAARKRQEKAALQAEDEANTGPGGKVKRVTGVKSKRKKGKNDFSLLEDTLVGDAEKKIRATKKAERLRKEREERLRLEKEKQKATELIKRDPLLRITDAMLEGNIQDGTVMSAPMGDGRGSSGIDAALGSLFMVKQGDDRNPEKRMKALHKAFEEQIMPEMKSDYPGLRMSQYKERIFALWKKSPENPRNWPEDDVNR